jgi:hypothetical protein
MRVKLYIDHDVKKDIAVALRTSGYDVLTPYEAGNQRLRDEKQLEYAILQGRAFLTCNQGDCVELHCQMMAKGYEPWGILIAKQTASVGEGSDNAGSCCQLWPPKT